MSKLEKHPLSAVKSVLLPIIISLVTTGFTVAYTAGKYIEKINQLEVKIKNHDDSLNEIKNTVNNIKTRIDVMTALLKHDYPNINFNTFIDQAIINHNSPSKIAKGLQELKTKDSTAGRQYLMDYYNFNSDQAKSVFSPATNSNPPDQN